MNADIFRFTDYQDFLNEVLSFDASGKRGAKSDVAKHLKCQSSFVSQVLGKRTHFSLEHGAKIAAFLGLGAREKKYFLLLMQKQKAGSDELRNHFDDELQSLRVDATAIKSRIKTDKVMREDAQAQYYSMWWYCAIHILSAFKDLRRPENIARKLNLDLSLVKDTLSFLESSGLVKSSKDGTYTIGMERVHLPKTSPLNIRHHTNWRMKVAEHLQRPDPEDLHYSALIGISREDGLKIRSMILEFISKKEQIVTRSPVEVPYVLLMDFFELKN
jgi:uncharacterized protein (TIGR02147 family)